MKNKMEEHEIWAGGSVKSTVLNNSGGPRSRVRSEKISTDIFEESCIVQQQDSFYFSVPESVTDVEDYLNEMACLAGYENLKTAFKNIPIPDCRLLVVPLDSPGEAETAPMTGLFRNALVLSKCNLHFYNPGNPMIFTKQRLHRNIKLIKINISEYYGMD